MLDNKLDDQMRDLNVKINRQPGSLNTAVDMNVKGTMTKVKPSIFDGKTS